MTPARCNRRMRPGAIRDRVNVNRARRNRASRRNEARISWDQPRTARNTTARAPGRRLPGWGLWATLAALAAAGALYAWLAPGGAGRPGRRPVALAAFGFALAAHGRLSGGGPAGRPTDRGPGLDPTPGRPGRTPDALGPSAAAGGHGLHRLVRLRGGGQCHAGPPPGRRVA